MISFLILSILIAFITCNEINGLPLHYGSLIRIKSSSSNHFLHSHKVPIQMDGPYSVTGFWIDNDANSLWSIQQPYSTSKYSSKSYKDTLKCGDNISLIHSLTGGSLQSFQGSQGMASPEQLVSNNHQSFESNSNWMVQCVDTKDNKNNKEVKFGTQFRLKHLNSNKYLEISKEYSYDQVNCGRGCIIMNHLEIHAVREKSPQTILSAVGGVTFV